MARITLTVLLDVSDDYRDNFGSLVKDLQFNREGKVLHVESIDYDISIPDAVKVAMPFVDSTTVTIEIETSHANSYDEAIVIAWLEACEKLDLNHEDCNIGETFKAEYYDYK